MGLLYRAVIFVDQHLSKKNGRNIMRGRGGRQFLGKSSRLISGERLMTESFKDQIDHNFKTLSEDLHAVYTFVFPHDVYYTKKMRRSKTLPDLSNLLELPSDCLQKAGIIENDTQIESFDGSRRVPGESYHLVVELYKFGGK